MHVDPLIDADMKFQYSDGERKVLESLLSKDRIGTLDRLNFNDYGMKTCSAGKNYVNIMPNGDVFRYAGGFDYFHSPLRKQVLLSGPSAPYDPRYFYMGNVFDDKFSLDTKSIQCELLYLSR